MQTEQISDIHINPSDETIHLGPITIRFLITADDSGGGVAVYVTGGILTFTVDGKEINIGPGGRRYVSREARFTSSTT